MPEILEKANRQCNNSGSKETANMQVNSVSMGRMAGCCAALTGYPVSDAQVAANKQHLVACRKLEMTLLQTIRVGRYADCHYPEKFESHLYWQWTVAFANIAETSPTPAPTLCHSRQLGRERFSKCSTTERCGGNDEILKTFCSDSFSSVVGVLA